MPGRRWLAEFAGDHRSVGREDGRPRLMVRHGRGGAAAKRHLPKRLPVRNGRAVDNPFPVRGDIRLHIDISAPGERLPLARSHIQTPDVEVVSSRGAIRRIDDGGLPRNGGRLPLQTPFRRGKQLHVSRVPNTRKIQTARPSGRDNDRIVRCPGKRTEFLSFRNDLAGETEIPARRQPRLMIACLASPPPPSGCRPWR